MTRKLFSLLVVFVLLSSFSAFPKNFQKDPDLYNPVLSAKTIAVIARVVDSWGDDSDPYGWKLTIESELFREVEKQKRFQLVSDPSKADLICLFIQHVPLDTLGPRGGTLTMMVLKGGNMTPWDAHPLWAFSGLQNPGKKAKSFIIGGTISEFHKDIKDLEKKLAKQRQSGAISTQEPAPTISSLDNAEDKSRPKLMLVCIASPYEECSSKAQSRMESDIAFSGKWAVVHDPAMANFVLLWFDGRYQGFNFEYRYASLYLLAGGAHPEWRQVPLAAAVGEHAENMVQEFARKSSYSFRR